MPTILTVRYLEQPVIVLIFVELKSGINIYCRRKDFGTITISGRTIDMFYGNDRQLLSLLPSLVNILYSLLGRLKCIKRDGESVLEV